jgi:hypothetical protein
MLSKVLKPVRWLRARLGLLFDIAVVGIAMILFQRYVPFGGAIIGALFLVVAGFSVLGVLVAVLHRSGWLGGQRKASGDTQNQSD